MNKTMSNGISTTIKTTSRMPMRAVYSKIASIELSGFVDKGVDGDLKCCVKVSKVFLPEKPP
jgi:hypothetical protein